VSSPLALQTCSSHHPTHLPVRAVRQAPGQRGRDGLADRPRGVDGQAPVRRRAARLVGGQHRQDACLPPSRLRRHRLRVWLSRHPAGVPDTRGVRVTHAYEISHLLSGVMLVTSFALLYQQRIAAVLNAFAAQSIVLALAVAWAAWSSNRPDLFITALIAFTLKGIVIPVALRRTVTRLGIHREVEKVVGVGVALMVGLALTGLAQALVVKVASGTARHARDELALALALILLCVLVMIVP